MHAPLVLKNGLLTGARWVSVRLLLSLSRCCRFRLAQLARGRDGDGDGRGFEETWTFFALVRVSACAASDRKRAEAVGGLPRCHGGGRLPPVMLRDDAPTLPAVLASVGWRQGRASTRKLSIEKHKR